MCRASDAGCMDDPVAPGRRIGQRVVREDCPATGIRCDMRFERHVRVRLYQPAKIAGATEGFGEMPRRR